MSQTKSSVISVGHGNYKANSHTSRIFTSNIIPTIWSGVVNYNTYDCVEINGNIYRAKTSNLGEYPSATNPSWEVLYDLIRNGDICIITNYASDIYIYSYGMWISLGSVAPRTVSLIDGQAVPLEVFNYPANSLTSSSIIYKIERVGGNTEFGELKILTDGVSNFTTSNTFELIGDYPKVNLVVTTTSGNIVVSYTSENLGEAIQFSYTIKGW